MRAAVLLLVATLGNCAAFAASPEADVNRALLERQQQSDEFALRLRQSQRGLQAAPAERADLDALFLQQRQQQQQLHDQQLQEAGRVDSAGQGGALSQRQERERRAFEQRPAQWGPKLYRPDPVLTPPPLVNTP
jgi:hypothetical protein